jgi:phosphotransferase system enzyme I (PtsI)
VKTQILKGVAASPGITIAQAHVVSTRTWEIPKQENRNSEQEILRFQSAIEQSKQELEQIYQEAVVNLGKEHAEIFEGHLFVLQDPEWIQMVVQKCKSDAINAEYALDQVTNQLAQLFQEMENEYMRERAADIKDVSRRVMSHLLGLETQVLMNFTSPVVIIAHDLAPSDTSQLDKQYVVGLATDVGGRTSHTAIIANSLEIPAVVGLKDATQKIEHQDIVILDGLAGEIIVNPSMEQQNKYEEKRSAFLAEKHELSNLANKKTHTMDGHTVELAANIGTPDDIESAIRNGAEGVGLFRSEFLYMNRKEVPSEEEQFQAYKVVADKMKGKSVIIRTLDIGGDKELPYLDLPKEANPFLGYRAIRFCLDDQDLFRTQLRAILRASHFGCIKIMYPMISTLEEIRQANQILEQAKEELKQKGILFDQQIEVGIMIEIPAAAVAADILATEVDFFSIGTNDLIQYTMACDRMNEKISYLYQPYHPAVLRLVRMAVQAAHAQKKWIGMCGEMAGDPIAIPILLGLGLDELSMSASSILRSRQLISQLDYVDMKKLADDALRLGSQAAVKDFVQSSIPWK